MKAIILAGGFATRLRPLSYALPKHLFPIAGKPVLQRLLDTLRCAGVKEVILALNYMADELKRSFGYRYRTVGIRYSVEPKPLGTAGPIRFAARLLKAEDKFIALNGDILADFQLAEMLTFHDRAGGQATISLKKVGDPSRFGVVMLDSSGRVTRFVEKPPKSDVPSRLVSAGAYVLKQTVLGLIDGGRKVMIESEVFPRLAELGRLYGFFHRGYWFDVGGISDYARANRFFLKKECGRKPILERHVTKSPSAKVLPGSFVGAGSILDPSATVGPLTSIGRNCRIGRRSTIRNSILFDGVVIGEKTKVEGAIVGNNVAVGSFARVRAGDIISGNSSISDGVKLAPGVIIHPNKEISRSISTPGHII